MKEGGVAELKTLKDYALVRGELYRRMTGGVYSRCMRQEKAQRKLKEVHDKTCGFCGEVSLYRRLQRAGFCWPSMGKDVDRVQTQCRTCQLAANREESYAVFISEDWRSHNYLSTLFQMKSSQPANIHTWQGYKDLPLVSSER